MTCGDSNPWEVSNLECFLFYCCPECDFKCQDIQGFEGHANDSHPQSKNAILRMKEVIGMVQGEKGHHFCKMCGKYFTSAQRWSSHMKVSHGDSRPYKCDICQAGFTQQADVQRHCDRIHKNERPFQCDTCDSKFARKYEALQHQKTVHEKKNEVKISGENNYELKCDACQAIFFSKAHFHKHNAKVHNISQSFECHICQKSLGGKNDLKRHIESVHEKRKPFMCSKCLATFSRKSYGKSHLKTVHQEDNMDLIIDTSLMDDSCDDTNNEKETETVTINVEEIEDFQKALFKCLPCKAIFLSEEAWKGHQSSAHSDVISCDTCDKRYASVYELNRHVKEVHEKGKSFQCSLCQSSFSRRYNCKDHLKKKHNVTDQLYIQEIDTKLLEEEAEEIHGEIVTVVTTETISDNVTEVTLITEPMNQDDLLKCDKCDFAFKSPFYMHQHFEQVHGVSNVVHQENHLCHICSAPFTNQDSLKHHINYVHEKASKPFLCDKCDKSFRSKSDLQRHINFSHEGVKEFQCDKCDYNASTLQNLTQHKSSVHDKVRNFKCVHCDSAFTQKTHLRIHLQNVHEKVKRCVCHMCGKGFADNARLQNHMDTRHTEPAQCDICLATFTSKVSLYRHHMSSHKNYPLSMDTTEFEFCPDCGMPCMNKLALKKHLYMHKNKDKFNKKQPKVSQVVQQPESHSCDLCQKQFRSKAGLDQHVRVIHHKIKGFTCHICQKSFGYKKTLECHISVVHENSGAFPCEMCGKRFAVKSTLQQHVASVHNKEERYKCDMCDKGFSRKDYYQIHVRSVHERAKPYVCEHCGCSYAQMGDMYRHVRKVHNVEPNKVRN